MHYADGRVEREHDYVECDGSVGMVTYEDNVKAGDNVMDTWAGESLLVTDVHWRSGCGWECFTERPDGSTGPTFYPHPDRMPDPDPNVYAWRPPSSG